MTNTDTGTSFLNTMTTNYFNGNQNGGNMFAFAAYSSSYTNRGFYNLYYRSFTHSSRWQSINHFRYSYGPYDLTTKQYDMITPQGSRTGKGTISPSYELDDYQMKLALEAIGSKNFDLKFNGAEITWPVVYYMDRDHVHRLDG